MKYSKKQIRKTQSKSKQKNLKNRRYTKNIRNRRQINKYIRYGGSQLSELGMLSSIVMLSW